MPEPDPGADQRAGPETAWQRQRRLAEVFGDVLPVTTSDERGDDGGAGERSSEEWLKAQVPPHHG